MKTNWWQWVILAILAVAGTMLGPLISAFAKTEEVAAALVPIAITPQIILAGVIAPLRGFADMLAKAFVTVYWAERGLESLLSNTDASLLRLDRGQYGWQVLVVGTHAAVFATATFLALWLQSRSRGRSWKQRIS